MRDWINLFEEAIAEVRIGNVFGPRELETIQGMLPQRWARHRAQPDFKNVASVTVSGKTIHIWSYPDNHIIYASEQNDETALGYINIKQFRGSMMTVAMAFVSSKARKRGIGKALYMYALGTGMTLVTDPILTKGSRGVWESLIADPTVEVTQIDKADYHDAGEMPERPVKSIDEAMRRDILLVARMKGS